MRPRIGITASLRDDDPPVHAVGDDYVRAVVTAGGLPLVLPNVDGAAHAAGLLAAVDGLLLTGGVDVDPAFYGELPAPQLGHVSPERDALEIPLVRAALEAGTPILAICRGIQVLNVAAGGTLYQDIAREVHRPLKHYQQAPRWYATHPIAIDPASRLAAILGRSDVRVNSFHHQAVRQVAPGFAVVARAPDGVVEAIELRDPSRFALGVQWHPEAMWERDPLWLELFRALVAAAGVRAALPAGALDRPAVRDRVP